MKLEELPRVHLIIKSRRICHIGGYPSIYQQGPANSQGLGIFRCSARPCQPQNLVLQLEPGLDSLSDATQIRSFS
jgi:hypothetical protein